MPAPETPSNNIKILKKDSSNTEMKRTNTITTQKANAPVSFRQQSLTSPKPVERQLDFKEGPATMATNTGRNSLVQNDGGFQRTMTN